MTNFITSFKLEGIPEFEKKLADLVQNAKEGSVKAVYREAETDMTISKRKVPVDTGTLRSTGHVEQPTMIADLASVELGYGGPAGDGQNVGYAVIVHEDLSMSHSHGQAKYLEEPMREEIASGRALSRMGRTIVNEIL